MPLPSNWSLAPLSTTTPPVPVNVIVPALTEYDDWFAMPVPRKRIVPEPLPENALPIERAESERKNVRTPLVTDIGPATLPALRRSRFARARALTTVPPLYVLVPVRMSVPEPSLISADGVESSTMLAPMVAMAPLDGLMMTVGAAALSVEGPFTT